MKAFLDLKIQEKKKACILLNTMLQRKNKTPRIKNKIRGIHISREIPNSQKLIVNKEKTINKNVLYAKYHIKL